jgi:hypothetical protein
LKKLKEKMDTYAQLKKMVSEATTTQGTAATKLPVDRYVLGCWGNYFWDRVTKAILSECGYITEEERSRYTRKALHDFIPTRYDGSTKTFVWPEPWKEDAKAAADKVTVALRTDEDKVLYRDEYWIPKNMPTLKGPNGEEVTLEQVVAHYDKNVNLKEVTLDRTHELCSRFSVFQNNPIQPTTNAKTLEFDALTDAQLMRLKEMKRYSS